MLHSFKHCSIDIRIDSICPWFLVPGKYSFCVEVFISGRTTQSNTRNCNQIECNEPQHTSHILIKPTKWQYDPCIRSPNQCEFRLTIQPIFPSNRKIIALKLYIVRICSNALAIGKELMKSNRKGKREGTLVYVDWKHSQFSVNQVSNEQPLMVQLMRSYTTDQYFEIEFYFGKPLSIVHSLAFGQNSSVHNGQNVFAFRLFRLLLCVDCLVRIHTIFLSNLFGISTNG